MDKNLKIAIEAAVKAGVEILKIYDTEDFGVEMKSDNSPLTKADKAANEKIMEYLDDTSFPVLSEEGKGISYDERKSWETFWLVDPLDGTKEFIKRNGEFTVNIALINNGMPIAGVVYVPVTKDLYYAGSEGAFKSIMSDVEAVSFETPVKLPVNSERDTFVVVGSRSHMSEETENYMKNLNTAGKKLEILSKGSSLKICMVAEGEADCYPRLGPTMEWDTAAGHAIALFAGKTVNVYPENCPLKYNKENLLNPYFIVD